MSNHISPQRILVVDDEPIVREALELMLIHYGHTAEVASDGPEALQKLAEQKFDLVFTDFNMPGMLGDELAPRIKKKYPQQIIAMVTAYSDFLNPRGRRSNPVDFIIAKPFALETICNAIARAHEINILNRKTSESSLPSPSNRS